jgi:hypothetical protein
MDLILRQMKPVDTFTLINVMVHVKLCLCLIKYHDMVMRGEGEVYLHVF